MSRWGFHNEGERKQQLQSVPEPKSLSCGRQWGLRETLQSGEVSASQRRQTESDQSSSIHRAPAPHPAYAIPSPTLSPTLAYFVPHTWLWALPQALVPSSFSRGLSLTQDILQASRAHFSVCQHWVAGTCGHAQTTLNNLPFIQWWPLSLKLLHLMGLIHSISLGSQWEEYYNSQ